ncbi:MAG: winged-helix domain-containing protein [Anaerolineales bacterium]|nr:winged-helix domain-containing protein [Anaerolineales bacterium]
MTTKTSILLVENNKPYAESLVWFLEEEGFEVQVVFTPIEARDILNQGGIDLAIIDIRLLNDEDGDDISGLELAKHTAPHVPKIVLTGFPTYEHARSALAPQVDGLQPAIDIVAKGDGPQALLTALRKGLALRGSTTVQPPTTETLGNANSWLNLSTRTVVVDGRSIDLTPQEFDIMEYFFRHPNRVISREELVREAIKEEYDSALEENRINNIIRRIRRKIEPDPSKPKYIQTSRGHGFELVL